ncbi:Platelet-activating factor acetylhydrolase IB subunit alpha [Aphelenchoides besseyi]|nr:Platelet-activating factor acetylhydrolase IB subunit alpha [Aphelenchoides besseyi]
MMDDGHPKYTVSLTTTQTEELNDAIAEYVQRRGYNRTFEVLAEETGAKVRPGAQHVGLLEKKWAMTLRLQQRIINLEKRIQELEGGGLLTHRHKDLKSATSWIPRPPEKLTLCGHRDSVMKVIFHPIYSVLLSCSEDHTIKIWDLETGQIERSFKAHLSTIQDLCFDLSGTRFASCSADSSIKIWDFGDSYECLKTLRGHSHTVSSVVFLPNKPAILSASRDGTIKQWDLTTGFCTHTYTEHEDWVRRVCVNEEGTLFATCSNDKSIIIWCLNTNKPLTKLLGHEHVIECVLFVPNQLVGKITKSQNRPDTDKKPTIVISAGRDRVIKVWDALAGVCLFDLEGHDNWIRDMVMHPSGPYLISVADDKTIRIWSMEETQRCRVIQGHDHFIYSVDFHKRLPFVATGCTDSSIKIWECR